MSNSTVHAGYRMTHTYLLHYKGSIDVTITISTELEARAFAFTSSDYKGLGLRRNLFTHALSWANASSSARLGIATLCAAACLETLSNGS